MNYAVVFEDDSYLYRILTLSPQTVKSLGQRLLTETGWRNRGIQMSQGWQHYWTQDSQLLFKKKK